jgi:DNA polymerase-3 subunit delta'
LPDFTFNGLSEPIIAEALVAREQTDKTSGKKHIKHRKLQHCQLLHADDEEHPLNNGL